MTGFKESMLAILEQGSKAFAVLKGIESWDVESFWENLGVIIEAANDGLMAIGSLREKLGDLVDDEEAQEDLAELLDEAVHLNVMLEAVDGMLFKVAIQTACMAVKPFMGQ